MHERLLAVRDKLNQLVNELNNRIPGNDPLGNVHGWNCPGLTREELVEEVESVIELIGERAGDDIGESDAHITDYLRRLDHLIGATVPQMWSGNAGQAVSAFLLTMTGLRKALAPVLSRDSKQEASEQLKRVTRQLRAMEARLSGLDPRTASLMEMVERIESAHSAADQLPTDLEALVEARKNIGSLERDAMRDQGRIASVKEDADEIDKMLKKCLNDATAVLERRETAYSASTSVGLAAAFSERSKELTVSMWVWVGGLVVALCAGSYFGSDQLASLSVLFQKDDVASSIVLLNLLLAVLSIGAPVWFAWLATKQIGQRFRLAEDYAFKASISRAYEGFRREAARFDQDMEARVLSSALTRLDELPLRLVESESHGSPWHELASSSAVKEAMRVIPGFAGSIKDLAATALGSVGKMRRKSPPSVVQAAEDLAE